MVMEVGAADGETFSLKATSCECLSIILFLKSVPGRC
jgi:hypothetical protein